MRPIEKQPEQEEPLAHAKRGQQKVKPQFRAKDTQAGCHEYRAEACTQPN